ncbi:hypothetical protein BN946_scf184839.g6 [Trametes cinnabarina]|uniref:Uncharacterized protein n=1 Tax=Pycnoporus cinnabarinus TaxID=5643 RepID=A0A060SJH7_PYCCI|nr:hypothetical protein BN946_scf184839.g6 [Trametes cinnabarina]
MSSSPEVDHINDPDYLCAFALTLHEINQDARRNSAEYKDAQKHYATLLDALARLAVREPRDQVVAIGAVMVGKSDPTELYVATNAVVPPYIVAHLDDICRRILHIRATIKTSPEPMRLLNAISQDRYVLKEPVTEPVLVALRKLQHVLYNHSIERLRARFAKLGWEEKLQHLFACINASSGAVVLDSLSEGEQYALERLKASPSVQNDFPAFEEGVQLFHDAIEKQDVAAIHDASVLLMGFNNRHAKASVLLLCDTFINAYAKRTGKGAGKHHSLSKWLSKISFVTAEYGKLIKIFTDSHLSDMFHDSVVIRPIANNPPMRPYTTALEPNAIKKTLNALEFTSDDFDDDEARTYAQLINDIQTTSARSTLRISSSGTATPADVFAAHSPSQTCSL